jgi:mitochondrial fission protein ELM1
VSVARYIREQTGGRARLVHVGNPRGKLDDFDLQITTPQYARGPARNLLELHFPIGNPARTARPSEDELRWLRAFPRPRRLVAVGGPARHWELDEAALSRAIQAIQDKRPAGSLIVAVSPRTRASTRRRLERLAAGPRAVVIEHFPRFGTLLAESDEIYVTADSVSMLAEAALTGKPVGMIPIQQSFRGFLSKWLLERPFGYRCLPNFRNFWDLLDRHGVVGTVELPVASQVCDTVERAADAVRSLLPPGDVIDEGRTLRTASDLGPARRPRRRQQSGNRAR